MGLEVKCANLAQVGFQLPRTLLRCSAEVAAAGRTTGCTRQPRSSRLMIVSAAEKNAEAISTSQWPSAVQALNRKRAWCVNAPGPL